MRRIAARYQRTQPDKYGKDRCRDYAVFYTMFPTSVKMPDNANCRYGCYKPQQHRKPFFIFKYKQEDCVRINLHKTNRL